MSKTKPQTKSGKLPSIRRPPSDPVITQPRIFPTLNSDPAPTPSVVASKEKTRRLSVDIPLSQYKALKNRLTNEDRKMQDTLAELVTNFIATESSSAN